MTLNKIRLELARTKETPAGDPNCGYEFIAPLDSAGHFDEDAWRKHREFMHRPTLLAERRRRAWRLGPYAWTQVGIFLRSW